MYPYHTSYLLGRELGNNPGAGAVEEGMSNKLAREYRPSMHPDVLHAWAKDAVAALERVDLLASKLEHAVELGTGATSVVAGAFAAEIRKALEGEE